jgi:hypothetical protein
MDLLIVSQNEPLAYFHNRTEGGHYVTFRLEGKASNRDAVGAILKVVCAGRTQVATRFGGGSYQSASDPRLHLGLGPASRIEQVEVLWPSGAVNRHSDLPADTGYLILEGATDAQQLAGFAKLH